ncbi:MAG: DUF4126 domain-containing protein [Candidatus Eisenbacteria bacterium]|nr:DUF4126 domain-containing protein [Candidatus Eisenbacteria bacterium]
MDLISALLGAFGLAVAAGLNAWIPVVLVGAAARWLPGGWIELSPQFAFLASDWFLIVASVMLVIELAADKIPLVDHANDIIQTVIRPLAGAVLFAAGSGVIDGLDSRLSLALGFLTAGSVHGAKSLFRPLVTATTGGVGNPIVSLIEDTLSLVATILAILIPLALIVLLIGMPIGIARWWAGRRQAVQIPPRT